MTIPVCVSIGAPSVSKIPALIEKAESLDVSFIEIRLDYLGTLDGIRKAIGKASVPLIATYRQHKQGGIRQQEENERIRKLLRTARHGFSYVDIELTAPKVESLVKDAMEIGVKPIVSYHDLGKTPKIERLKKILQKQIDAGAEICKLVTTANKLSDNLPCLSLVSEMSMKTKIVCFAIGKKGLLSRVLSPIFGAYFTYASLEAGLETALGQPSVSEVKRFFDLLDVEK